MPASTLISPRTLSAFAAGAGLAVPVIQRMDRSSPAGRRALGAIGLSVAAAVYPLARTDRSDRARTAREMGAVAGFTAVSLAAARRTGTRGSRLLAAGWLAHAWFDARHDPGPGSRLPSTYAAGCAGFDLAMAAALARPVQHP